MRMTKSNINYKYSLMTDKLKSDKERNSNKIEQSKMIKTNEKTNFKQGISKIEQSKKDLYDNISQIEAEIQNSRKLITPLKIVLGK